MYKGILFKRAFYIFSQKKILLRNKATVQIRMNFIIKFQNDNCVYEVVFYYYYYNY